MQYIFFSGKEFDMTVMTHSVVWKYFVRAEMMYFLSHSLT